MIDEVLLELPPARRVTEHDQRITEEHARPMAVRTLPEWSQFRKRRAECETSQLAARKKRHPFKAGVLDGRRMPWRGSTAEGTDGTR